MLTDFIKTEPAVFAVGENYQIMVEVTCPVLMWVKIGDECYYNDSNGIIRSNVTTQRITVPMTALDEAGSYTLCVRKIIERKPYRTETEDEVQNVYPFVPVKKGRVIAYQIADAHNMVAAPVEACRVFEKKYGEVDFLIMNGDVPDHSGKIENFHNIYDIAAQITHGSKPVVFSRGNHDTRGFFAENIAEHTPVENGNSFFTVHLGDVWAVVLDCGEDKDDSHIEYGHTVCCHFFRQRETRWLNAVAAKGEYVGVKHRVVICHNPFTWTHEEPFDIEKEIYGGWSELLKQTVKPELFIAGHLHELTVSEPGDKNDWLGHPCRVVSGSLPRHKDGYFAGSGFVFDDGIEIYFNDNKGNFIETV